MQVIFSKRVSQTKLPGESFYTIIFIIKTSLPRLGFIKLYLGHFNKPCPYSLCDSIQSVRVTRCWSSHRTEKKTAVTRVHFVLKFKTHKEKVSQEYLGVYVRPSVRPSVRHATTSRTLKEKYCSYGNKILWEPSVGGKVAWDWIWMWSDS